MWNALNQKLTMAHFHDETRAVRNVRIRKRPNDRGTTDAQAASLAHPHDSAWFCWALAWKSISLLDAAWVPLENRPMIDFQKGTKQDQAEKHHTRSFPYLNSTHDRFALDDQAEHQYKRAFPYLKSTNDRFALDDQAENQYKRHYNIATFNIPVLKIAIFCRIAPL